MKEIRKSTQFKKDFKRIKNNEELVKALMDVVTLLEQGEKVPDKYKPHMLKGEFKGIMECHVDSDSLLMWVDDENNIVRLLRVGSHAELFGM